MPEPFLAIAPLAAFVPLAADVPPGVDVDTIVAEVRETGVSAPPSIEDALLGAVDRAEDNGIDLSIVVVENNPSHDSQLRDLATAVGAQDGGTVLVLSPGQVGSFSDTVSRVTLEAGQDRTYTGDPVVAADNFVDELVGDQTPWALMTGVIVVIVAGAAAATAVAKIRRRSTTVQTTES
ncbi:Rv1476 family membrane protein [Rhodococcoides kyotonense]|uniref:TPM domain-containing protein n=1 Tax=Rhodococcoides kyotonense TaxID=398843 RepID=A0A239CPE0_9NOCA|nr:DUF6676 family protein [Rhodococcus kyotonensis]SNS21618.1 hypothetical protein SAMN05421642_101115 [Rhodococcus kyotonensis]